LDSFSKDRAFAVSIDSANPAGAPLGDKQIAVGIEGHADGRAN
jgi:hypothetical protein